MKQYKKFPGKIKSETRVELFGSAKPGIDIPARNVFAKFMLARVQNLKFINRI